MGKGFSEVILSQVRVGIQLKEMEVRVDMEDFFQDWKGDEMVSSEEDGEFILGQDFTKGILNEIKSYLLLSQREFQISHVMDQ
jgi:hypothetical protein